MDNLLYNISNTYKITRESDLKQNNSVLKT